MNEQNPLHQGVDWKNPPKPYDPAPPAEFKHPAFTPKPELHGPVKVAPPSAPPTKPIP